MCQKLALRWWDSLEALSGHLGDSPCLGTNLRLALTAQHDFRIGSLAANVLLHLSADECRTPRSLPFCSPWEPRRRTGPPDYFCKIIKKMKSGFQNCILIFSKPWNNRASEMSGWKFLIYGSVVFPQLPSFLCNVLHVAMDPTGGA